ncbi:thiamine phosphate synthase [Octadecabacter sp. G9-8]|uniref:Thiamine phosphate synthase n=1 Tax=Octadecabacter dasysiphoniae TaxID=2909341 RepID=A0ABS9CU42_9RHOB|nr:thiamine phosphate synthase [Octadecabacter dasysiphoniae]MCF2870760.1 thiamine phosphate synthase [Octadecabacter dasysiphoniae]
MTDDIFPEKEPPRIYLITPSEVDLATFPDRLTSCLDATDVACVRLSLGSTDETVIAKTADALRLITHDRDVALVIDTHVMMVERLGLDGVHLTDAARTIKAVRKELGDDAIIGSNCYASRHNAMTACELGADYITFGPVGDTPLGNSQKAELELFQWWSQMIEVPVVAEGALTEQLIGDLSPHTDFFGIGDEVWGTDNPAKTLAGFAAQMV